jgi:hypothetical protein
MPITYSDVTLYLDAIADNANGLMSESPHQYWWHQNPAAESSPYLSYKEFVTGTVNGVRDNQGNPIPIIGTDSKQTNPLQSTFYILLTTSGGNGTFPQMPKGGPFVTDPGFSVELNNGVTVSGEQIMANLKEWLGNGYPDDEKPAADVPA